MALSPPSVDASSDAGKRPSTHDAILECVIGLIEERGEAGVRIAEVTAATKASISSIYHFFTDREGLIAAAQAERYVRSLSGSVELLQQIADRSTNRADLRASIIQFLEWISLEERAPYRLTRLNVIGATLGRPVLKERIAAIQEDVMTKQAAIYADLQSRDLFRSDVDAKALSATVMGIILGRSLIEIGETSVESGEWLKIQIITVDALFFGDQQAD